MEPKASTPLDLFVDAALVPVARAYAQVNHLIQLYRQGWLRRGIARERCESVADHSAGVGWLTLLLAGEIPGLDSDRALRMALIHDMGEAHAGDITPADNVPEETKHAQERAGLARVLAGVRGGDEWMSLWEEYEAGATLEARFVRQVDRLEMGLHAAIYGVQGLVDSTDFVASARAVVEIGPIRDCLESLVMAAGPASIT